MDTQLYKITEAAPMMRLSVSGLRKMMAEGKVRGIKIGRRWLIPGSEVERILEEGTRPAVLAGGREHPRSVEMAEARAVVRDPVSTGETRQASGRGGSLIPRVIG